MARLDQGPDRPATSRIAEPGSHSDVAGRRRASPALPGAGADDVGFVALDRPELDDQRADILRPLPVDADADQPRLPDEPGADPQPGPLGRQPGVPPHRRQANEIARQIVARWRPRGSGR